MSKKEPFGGFYAAFWIFLFGMLQRAFDPSRRPFDPISEIHRVAIVQIFGFFHLKHNFYYKTLCSVVNKMFSFEVTQHIISKNLIHIKTTFLSGFVKVFN
jgi:hypothetical protein